MSVTFSYRRLFFLGFAVCLGLIVIALFLQYRAGLEPCPLCIFQRIFVILLGLLWLLAGLHNPTATGRRIYGGVTAVLAATGVGIAARHVWLQNLPPDQLPGCGYGLQDMLHMFPLSETLALVFRGSGDCTEVAWTFLGLSIPAWTLVFFTAFVVYGLWLIFPQWFQWMHRKQ